MILISYDIINLGLGLTLYFFSTKNLIMYIVKTLDNKEISLSLFLDLSKAFDCLDHSLLLCKLEYYGIHGILLNWFLRYLIVNSMLLLMI